MRCRVLVSFGTQSFPSRPALQERNPRGDIVFITTGWRVEEKYEKYKKVFATVLASFNPTGK